MSTALIIILVIVVVVAVVLASQRSGPRIITIVHRHERDDEKDSDDA